MGLSGFNFSGEVSDVGGMHVLGLLEVLCCNGGGVEESEIMELTFVMKEGSWYKEFFTFGYPFPVLNLLRFIERVITWLSVSTGGGV